MEKCVHYWVIATPSGGATSVGVCKLCGEERDHSNSFPAAPWGHSSIVPPKEGELLRDVGYRVEEKNFEEDS